MDGHHETHLGWAKGQSRKKRSRQFFCIAYNNNYLLCPYNGWGNQTTLVESKIKNLIYIIFRHAENFKNYFSQTNVA
jgi:hypothetical protein